MQSISSARSKSSAASATCRWTRPLGHAADHDRPGHGSPDWGLPDGPAHEGRNPGRDRRERDGHARQRHAHPHPGRARSAGYVRHRRRQVRTFNISTTVAFIAAAAGIPVAKHGNRASTSKCGSADVLAELGVDLDLTPEQVGHASTKSGWLPVRCAAPPGHEVRHRPAPPAWRAHDFQHPRPPDQSRRGAAPVDGRLHPGHYRPAGPRPGGARLEVGHDRQRLRRHRRAGETGPNRVSHFQDGKVTTYELDPLELGFEGATSTTWRAGTQPPTPRSCAACWAARWTVPSGMWCCSTPGRRSTRAGWSLPCWTGSPWRARCSTAARPWRCWTSSSPTPGSSRLRAVMNLKMPGRQGDCRTQPHPKSLPASGEGLRFSLYGERGRG